MIVRPLADGHTALIGQTDHSRLVGQLAAHWGNDQFAAPVERSLGLRRVALRLSRGKNGHCIGVCRRGHRGDRFSPPSSEKGRYRFLRLRSGARLVAHTQTEQ